MSDVQPRVHYVAALKPDRFRLINKFLSYKVTKSGDTASSYNHSRGEAAVLHWSIEQSVGKKLCMSNAFDLKRGKKVHPASIPVYDHYKNGFSGCDSFNRDLHGKTYPYVSRNSRAGADRHCGWNYLFACVLLNVYNAYLFLNDVDSSSVSFNVCATLARDLVK